MLLLIDASNGVLVTEDEVDLVGASTLVRSKHDGLIEELLDLLVSMMAIAPID